MRTVSERFRDLYFKTDRCVKCGRCSAVCPTYNVTQRESMLARGRIRLVREYIEEDLPLSDRLKLYNELCLGCGACIDACPAHVETPELVTAMKEETIRQYGMPVSDSIMLKKVLSSPQSFRRIIRLMSLNRKIGLAKLLPEMLKTTDSLMPEIPRQSFRDVYFRSGRRESAISSGKRRVGYFVGCLTNALYPSLAFDVIKVLEYHDCEVVIPAEHACCGLPQRFSGDAAQARKMAARNIEAFQLSKVDYVVTDCSTCSHALKDYQWYDWLSDDEQEKAREFSKKTFDINEFLVDVAGLRVGPNVLEKCSVTYHDSCHLKRSQKITVQPREILRSIPGVEYREMPEADWCCGAAGSYSFKHHDVSIKILQRKMDNVKSTGAQYVAAGCPACIMQLQYGMREFSPGTEALHPVQLLARSF